MTLLPKTWPEVREAWGWVRNGLLDVIAETKERWLPEEVFAALQAGTAHLFALDKDGDEVGFVILRRLLDPDGPVLFVWCLWSEPGAVIVQWRELRDHLRDMALRMGAKRMRFESPRKGYQFFHEFEPVKTIYELEITP